MSRSRSKGSDLVWEKRKSHPLSTACRSLESEQKSEKWRWRGMGDMSEQRGRYMWCYAPCLRVRLLKHHARHVRLFSCSTFQHR